jgi:muconate cycloisomerase
MRVTRVVLHEVVVPTHEGRVNSERYGPAEWDTASKVIIELETDAGLIGLSETLRCTPLDMVRTELEAAFAGREVEALCWQEPAATEELDPRVPSKPRNHFLRVFIQVAYLDLVGKKSGLPASALLGGAYRDRVSVDAWMGQMTPEDSARAARAAKRTGYRGIKCKCTLDDDNVARAEAVRDACGADFKITFDPNYRFHGFAEAIGMLRALAAVGNVGCIEDPFPPGDFDAYRSLRREELFPVALHNSLSDTTRVLEAIRAGAADCLNLSLWPSDTRKAADFCDAAGIPAWHGSGVELGILEAAYLHTAATTRAMTRPSDLFGRAVREHNLIIDSLDPVDGLMTVPRGPGLGVTLDRDALDRYTVRTMTHDFP